jgi:heme/copper-type cytochrome/quinol oxidase subunit 4
LRATQKYMARMRLGFIVLAALMVIEIVEYAIGVTMKRGSLPYLAVLAIIGAWPIVQYFMHIAQLWHREED